MAGSRALIGHSARLSVHQRLTITFRVVEEGWTVTAAAEAAT